MKPLFYVLAVICTCLITTHSCAQKKETRQHIEENIAEYTRDILKDSVQALKYYAENNHIGTDRKIITTIANTQELLIRILEDCVVGGNDNCIARATRTELLQLRSLLNKNNEQNEIHQKESWWQNLIDKIQNILINSQTIS